MDADRRVLIGVKLKGQVVNLIIRLFLESAAQKTIRNFYNLIISGAYKETKFSRVIAPEFIIQGGYTGSSQERIVVDYEVSESTTQLSRKGIVAVASDIDQEPSSEFFITLDDLSEYEVLQGRFVALGMVENGLDELIDLMKEVDVDFEDKPLEDIFIVKTGELQKKTKQKHMARRLEVEPEKIESLPPKTNEHDRSSRDDDRRERHRSPHHRHHHHKDSRRHRDSDSYRYRDDRWERENDGRNFRDTDNYISRKPKSYRSSQGSRSGKDYSDRDPKRLKSSSSHSYTRDGDELRKGRGFR